MLNVAVLMVISALSMPSSRDSRPSNNGMLISSASIEAINTGLASGGSQSRITTFTLDAGVDEDQLVLYLEGTLEMSCGDEGRLVDTATTHFVVPAASDVSQRDLPKEMRGTGYKPANPGGALTFLLSDSPDDAAPRAELKEILLRYSIRLCNTPAHQADYMELILWEKFSKKDKSGVFYVGHPVISEKRYKRLTP